MRKILIIALSLPIISNALATESNSIEGVYFGVDQEKRACSLEISNIRYDQLYQERMLADVKVNYSNRKILVGNAWFHTPQESTLDPNTLTGDRLGDEWAWESVSIQLQKGMPVEFQYISSSMRIPSNYWTTTCGELAKTDLGPWAN